MSLILMRLTKVGTFLANSNHQIRNQAYHGHMSEMSINNYYFKMRSRMDFNQL